MGNVCCQQESKPNNSKYQSPPIRKVLNNGASSSDVGRENKDRDPAQFQNPKQKNNQNVNPAHPHIISQRQASSPDIFSSTSSVLPKHGPENYQSIKYLGKGTFGNVVLAEDKQNGRQYAMKIIQKKKIKQLILLQNEMIKKISQCQLFVRIRETFQNESKIYIVMEYLPRGDIYFYLKTKTCVFSEEIIKNLLAEIIVGIQFLHQQDIVYRELKPENVFVTNQGHIKLADYGLSKMTQNKNPLSTFVGTLEYTAPQAIHGNYDKKADIWAIGVLMYQLKFQKNLFETQQQQSQKTQQKIESINIEKVVQRNIGQMSQNFRNVLVKLLQNDPQKRITLAQLKKQPFFSGIVWQDIPLRKNPPPLKQILESDHIKFRDPHNSPDLAHRKLIENKKKQYEKKNLFQFRDQLQVVKI